jgi:hypothetical protein
MKFAPMALALVLAAGLSSIARAEDLRCPASAEPATLSLEQAVGKAEALGYAVKEAKRKRSCWKIEGFDRNGAEIEIYFDAGSGAVIRSRYWRAPSNG